MKTKNIIAVSATIALFATAGLAFAQSTVTGTLSSGGTSNTGSGTSVTGTVGSGNTVTGSVGSGNSLSGTVTPSNTVTGTVGSGNTLTGTVTSPSSGGGGGGGGGTSAPGNGPPVGGGGGGSGSNSIVVCPNLSDPYTLPAGYVIVNGNCEPSGPGVPNTGGSGTTLPGVPNTGAGGNAEENILLLLGSLGAFGVASTLLVRKRALR